MRWVYNYHVLHNDDVFVCCYESCAFEIKTTKWTTATTWEVVLEVYDFWNATDMVVFFRLAQ